MSRSSPWLSKESPKTFKQFWIELHPDWFEFANGKNLTEDRWDEIEPELLVSMKREYVKCSELLGWQVTL
jgi:hypothetical protein